MSLNRGTAVETPSRAAIPNLEPREYDMRLVYVADLGMQQDSYMGELKDPCRKVALGFEVIGEFVELGEEEFPRIIWGKAFNIFNKLTDKGTELKYYKLFDSSAEGGQVPDWEAQLGKPCIGNINEVEGKGKSEGIFYNNLATVMAMPAKYQDDVAPNVTAPGIGDCDDPDNHVTQALFGLAKWMFDRRLDEA